MPSVTTPIWLLGLGVIPLVWWLHRLGDPDAAAPVSAGFLFDAHEDETSARRKLRRADPVWMLRAALLGSLVLALAGLQWPRNPERHITVWLDDSLSMQTREAGQSRTLMAAQDLTAALEAVGPASVRVRSLSDHRQRLDATSLAGGQLIETIARRAAPAESGSPRIPFFLPAEREHWVVSDGADPRVNTWIEDALQLRSLAVGSETENAAVTAIMARRSLQDGTLHFGSVRVHNLGAEETRRTLTVRADNRVLLSEEVAIGSSNSAYRDFRVPADTARLAAKLSPADALVLDDELEVALDGLRPAVVDFDNRCGPHLRRAIDAHPGLRIRSDAGREGALTVQCASSPGQTVPPSISVHTADSYRGLTGAVRWRRTTTGPGGMSLEPSWLRVDPGSAPPPSDLTLLTSPEDGVALINQQPGVVDVFLDLEWAPFTERPEYPLLVNQLVELALGRPVLDPVIRAERNPAESRIARQPAAGTKAPAAIVTGGSMDLTGYLLALAAVLLLADLFLCMPVRAPGIKASRGAA